MPRNLIHLFVVSLLFAAHAATADAKPLVGVAWYGKSGMAKAVLSGVQDRLSETAPGIELEIRGELAGEAELARAAQDFQSGGKDGMIILRSSGSAYLAENPPAIPTFIGGNNHPVELGAVDNLTSPSGNVTGVTYYIPLIGPLESFMALAPQVDSFLLVSQTGYSSSPIDGKGTMAACDALSITCKQVFATGADEVGKVVSENIADFGAVILGNQAAVFSHADAALAAAGGKPVFSYAEKGVSAGALGGVIANDHKLGEMLADSLVDVLVNGKAIKDVDIKMDPEPILIINMSTAAKLGIEPPAELLGVATLVE